MARRRFRGGDGVVDAGVWAARERMRLLRAWRLRTGVERVREGFFEGVQWLVMLWRGGHLEGEDIK